MKRIKQINPVVFFALIICFISSMVHAYETVSEEWIRTYDGAANDYDSIMGMALNKNGNIYVLGFAQNESRDYVTIKYDENGSTEWTAIYDGPDGLLDQPHDIDVDEEGNIYVTGFVGSETTEADIATLKYNPQGEEQWVAIYNSTYESHEIGRKVISGPDNNVYVAGFSGRSTEYINLNDSVVLKYDKNGNLLWESRYSEGGEMDFAHGLQMVIVPQYGIYVAGGSGLLPESDFYDSKKIFTAQYDFDGNMDWLHTFELGTGIDDPRAMDVDSDNNIYIAGQDCENLVDDCDFITIKMSADGEVKWVRQHGYPGDNDSKVYALSFDSQDNVIVTGNSEDDPNNFFYKTIKYDNQGNELWLRRFDTPYEGDVFTYDVTVDKHDCAYVTGTLPRDFIDPYTFNKDIVTVKYSEDGELLWSKDFNRIESGSSEGGEFIAVDDSGNIYVAGDGTSRDTGVDIILIKYSPCQACKIDDILYCDGEVNGDNPCLGCDVSLNEDGWTALDAVPCDDGLFCNGADFCVGGECAPLGENPCDEDQQCNEESDQCVDDMTDDDDGQDYRVEDDSGGGCCG